MGGPGDAHDVVLLCVEDELAVVCVKAREGFSRVLVLVDGDITVFCSEIDVVREDVIAGIDISKREFEHNGECTSYSVWIPLRCIAEVATVSVQESIDVDLAACDIV